MVDSRQMGRETSGDARALARAGLLWWRSETTSGALECPQRTWRELGLAVPPASARELLLASVHPKDRDAVMACWQRALEGQYGECEYRLEAGDVTRSHCLQLEPECSAEGAVLAVFALVRLLSVARPGEESATGQGGRWRALIEAASEGVAIIDQQHQVLEVNQQFADMLGYRRDELVGLHSWDIDADMSEADIRQGFSDLESVRCTIETRHQRKDGSTYHAEVNISGLKLDGQALVLTATRDISERKQVEERLRQSRQAMAEAQEIAQFGSWELDLTSGVQVWSAQMYRIFRKDPASFRPDLERIMDDVHPDDRDAVRASFQTALREHTRYDLTHRLLLDGEVRYIEARGEAYYDEQGVAVRAVGTVHDVSRRMLAETALRERERELAAIIDNIPVTVFVKDARELRYVRMNRACEDLMGVRQADALGKNDYDFFPPEQADFFVASDRQVIASGEIHEFPSEPINTPAGQRQLHTRKVVVPDERGEPQYLLGISEDITERRRAEQELERHRHALQALVDEQTARVRLQSRIIEQVRDAIVSTDCSGAITSWNPAAERIFGHSLADVLGQPISGVLAPAAEALANSVEALTALGGEQDIEREIARADGSHFHARLSFSLLHEGTAEPVGMVVYATDISARRLVEERNRQLLAILNRSPDFIASASMDGEIRYLNPAGYRLMGLDPETPADTLAIADFHTAASLANIRDEAHPATQAQGAWQGESTFVHSDGHEIPVLQTILVHQDAQGRPSYLSTIVRDISEQKAAEQRLLEEKHRAEEAARAKSAFLANMSHEVRTPMNAIIGMAHLVLQSKLDASQRNYVQKIHHAGSSLSRILDDIIDVSKIESGRLELEEQPFDLEGLLDDTLALNKIRAYERDIALRLVMEPDLPTSLAGDALRVGQVINNLVNNAIKFSHAGGEVLVTVTLDRIEGEQVWLTIAVSDSGIGLSPEQQSRLFTAFTQADNSTTRKYGGSGLGLAISRNIVELMGGTLRVDSALGEGSTFSFSLGLRRSQPLTAQSIASPDQDPKRVAARLYGHRVLLVEDNDINMELVMDLLLSKGMQVDSATDGRQAVARIDAGERYDLILMDCQMPVMDGYEATRRIRRQHDAAALPVIALTANVMAEDRQAAAEAGMNDHIGKPISPDALFATLARWIPAATDGS